MSSKPIKNKAPREYKFIDLFAGIGGFHLAFHNLGSECVFVSEWDAHARETYEANFKKISPSIFKEGRFAGDITKVNEKSIPEFDILTGGFPCQPFSQAGHKKGFDDIRGTLFFDIVRILNEKRPKAFFIENVRGLLTHDGGRTFAKIKETIENELGYSFYWKIVKASDFGLPQHRPRLYMVGFRDKGVHFEFPEPVKLKKSMSDIFGAPCTKKVGYTLRLGGRGSGLNDRRNWDTYVVSGKARRLTPVEGKAMMGFPKGFKFPVTESQAMRQLGNSVAVKAVQAVAERVLSAMNEYYGKRK